MIFLIFKIYQFMMYDFKNLYIIDHWNLNMY